MRGDEGRDAFLTHGVQLSRQEREARETAGDIGFHPEGTDRRPRGDAGRPGAGARLEQGWQGSFVDDITIPQSDGFGGTIPTRFGGCATHDRFPGWTPQDGALRGYALRLRLESASDKDHRNSLAGDDGPGRSFKVTLMRAISW